MTVLVKMGKKDGEEKKKKTPLNITCKDARELGKLSEMDLGR